MKNHSLQNQLIIITGASQGIGAATARRLAKEGARLILLARSQGKLAQLVDEIEHSGGTAVYHPIDLSDAAATRTLGAELVQKHGVPDIVFHNAGAGEWKAVDETSTAELRFMMDVPFFAAFNLTAALLPSMIKQNKGHFIVINSPVSYVAWPGATGYASARFALRGFIQGLRGDVRGTDIKVSEVVVGETTSNYFTNNPGTKERIPRIAKIIPTLTPEQVADTVAYAARKRKRTVIHPFMLRLFIMLQRIMPTVVEFMVHGTGWQRP